MTNEIDSSKVVLWQYDKAATFLRLLQSRDDFMRMAVSRAWDKFRGTIFDIQAKDWLTNPAISDADRDFALWIWSSIIGVSRPIGKDHRPLSIELFRRLLLARNYLYLSNGSLASLNRYCSILFNAGAGSAHPSKRVRIIENFDMTIKYEFNWELSDDDRLLIEVDTDNDGMSDVLPHPTGVQEAISTAVKLLYFGFDGFVNEDGRRLECSLYRTWYLSDSTGDKEVWTKELFDTDGIKYSYDSSEDDYYIEDTESGDKIWATEQVELNNVFNSSDSSVRRPIAYYEKGRFQYAIGEARYVADAIYWKDPDDDSSELRELTHDDDGWFYLDDEEEKVYVLGQSLGTFDESIFNDNQSS